ncbi:MAG TPA: hypothetical protein PLX06_09300 [Fimbriimonadaceae bacterium]|nr:hypothetical protein [Fimbriimonadaceae bacterium]
MRQGTPLTSRSAIRTLVSSFVVASFVVSGLTGCGSKPPPDPNDPSAVGIMQPEVLRRNLKWASDMVNDRVAKNEISDSEGKQYLTKYANELVDKIDFKQMDDKQAWQYAEVFRTAERWDIAQKALELAVAHAKKSGNQDRWVNDTLRLAQCMAHQGKRKEAIDLARTVFETRERDKAPILLAVTYEIAPALRGHGLDIETAKLIEDAIGQHMQVMIDPKTEAGQAFLGAKWHHIRKAWDLAVSLYREAGREDLADAARERAAKMFQTQGRL